MSTKNKIFFALSCLITLLPSVAALVLRNFLPEEMALHWGADGVADRFGDPFPLLLLLPLFLLALHLICIFSTLWAVRRKKQSPGILNMIFWILPVLSLTVGAVLFSVAFRWEWDLPFFITVPLAVLMIIIGNYMPKCKQNRTMGIKLPWTLANEENWQKTHRLAGILWVICGVLVLPAAFLPLKTLLAVDLTIFLAAVLIPTVYSFLDYRKRVKSGEISPEKVKETRKKNRISTAVGISITFVTLIVCGVLLFTGSVTATVDGDLLKVEATYHSDLSLDLSKVEEIEYREEGISGSRVFGFGSPRLSLGTFQNEEFGNYTCYRYTQVTPCILLKTESEILVLNLASEGETKALFELLKEKTEERK